MKMPDRYVPALRFRWLTPLYDLVVGVTTREKLFKGRLLRQAGLRPRTDVLDLGCGTGTLAWKAKRSQPEARVVGLDGDRQILNIARRKAHRGGDEVDFTLGLSHHLPFADGSFDRVLSSLFFHHLEPEQKTATLAEVRRVLRPDGELHIADWGAAEGPLERALFIPVQLLDGFSPTRDHVAGKLPHYLTRAGFAEVEIRESLLTLFGTLSLFSGRRTGA